MRRASFADSSSFHTAERHSARAGFLAAALLAALASGCSQESLDAAPDGAYEDVDSVGAAHAALDEPIRAPSLPDGTPPCVSTQTPRLPTPPPSSPPKPPATTPTPTPSQQTLPADAACGCEGGSDEPCIPDIPAKPARCFGAAYRYTVNVCPILATNGVCAPRPESLIGFPDCRRDGDSCRAEPQTMLEDTSCGVCWSYNNPTRHSRPGEQPDPRDVTLECTTTGRRTVPRSNSGTCTLEPPTPLVPGRDGVQVDMGSCGSACDSQCSVTTLSAANQCRAVPGSSELFDCYARSTTAEM